MTGPLPAPDPAGPAQGSRPDEPGHVADPGPARHDRDADGPTHVRDTDAARARRTASLLGILAGALGAPLRDATVVVDDTAASALRPHGARGLVERGRILLDPAHYDPGTADGRRLLAHEAVHLLQQQAPAARIGAPALPRARRGLAAAEGEAERIGRALAAGGPAAAPRVRLGSAETPLDVGFERLSDADVEAEHPDLLDALRALVGDGAPDGDAVDAAVQRLDRTELASGAGAVHALDATRRRRLAGRLGDQHRRERRHGALAVLLGLEREERRIDLDADDLRALDLSGLTPAEHHGAVDLLRSLEPDVLTELLEEADNRLAVERLMSSPLPETTAEERPETPPRPDDPTPRGPVPGADPDDPRVQAVVEAVRSDLAETSRDGALRALRSLGSLFQPPRNAGTGEAGTEAPPGGLALLTAAVEALEGDGSIDRLLEGLPEDHAELAERDQRTIDAVLTVRPLRRGDDRLVDPNAERADRLLSRSITDWAVTDSDARQAYPLVLAVARTRPSIFTRLDARGKVDTLFEELPDDFLYRADTRATTGEIMGERTPDRLFEGAREKLSRSFLDWAVTARDAYLASRMVEALPPDRREEFAELDGGALWERMSDEMTGSMRTAVDRHGFDRGNALAHRDQVRTQLADPERWVDDEVATLRTLVVFALTLGDGEWVFGRSREFRAYEEPEVRRQVVTPFGLYDPDAGRETWDPDTLEGTGFFEEGIFQAAANVTRILGAGVALLGDLTLAVTERGLDASVSLERLADAVGGDLGGLQLRTAEDAAAEAATGTTATPRPEGTNRVRVRWEQHGDGEAGRLTIDLPALDVASFRQVTHARTLSFGRLRLDGLHVAASYTAGERHRPTNLQVRGDGLDVADALYGASESLSGASRLRTGALEVRGGTERVPSSVPDATPGRTLGFWAALVAIFERIGALVDLTGSWESQASALTAFEVHVASLRVDGFVAGDRRIGTIAATDLRIGYATSALGHLRLLERSLERRLARAAPEDREALRERLAEVRAEVRERERDEAERQRLEDRYQRNPASLTDDERAELRRLRGQGGVTADAAALHLSDVGGSVRAGRLDLQGVSAEARFPGTLPAYAPTGVRVREFLDVGPPGAHDLERPHVRLHVDRAAFGDVTVAGEVPTEEDLRERLAEIDEALDAAAPEEDTAALRDRRAALDRALSEDLPAYQALETQARNRLAEPLSAAEERTRAALRARLRALDAIRVRSGTLADLEIKADLAGVVQGVAAGAADVQGIEAGGLGIERLAGTDLRARLTTAGVGAEGLANLPDSLQAATVQAGTLDVHGLSSEGRRLVEHAHVEAADAAVTRTEDGWRLDRLHLDRLAVTGFRVAAGDHVLTTTGPDGADATVELVDVDAAGHLRISEEGDFEHATVETLAIGAVRAPQPLHYTGPGGRRLRLAADALRGIRVTGLEVPLTGESPPPTAGQVSVQAIDRLTVAGRFTSALTAAVRFDSDPRRGQTLDVTFTPEGVEVTELQLGSIRADRLLFDDGERRVTVDGPALLQGVTARASVGLSAEGAITVQHLRVERLTAPSVSYRDATRELEATGGYDRPGEVTVEGLWVRGLKLAASGELLGAELGVDRLRAGIAGTFAPGVVGSVEIDVEGVGLDITPAFTRLSIGSLHARGGVTTAEGTVAGFDVSGLGVGAAEWDGRTLRLGTDTEDGLTIDRVALTTLVFASPELELDLGTTGTGTAALTGVRVKATVEFAETGGEVDFSHFTAELDEVHADQLSVEGLTVRLPGHDIELVFPAGFVTTAGPIDLVPNAPERLLVERVPTLAGSRLDVQGRVEIPRVVVPRVRAAVGGWLDATTRLELDNLRAGMLHSGEVTLRLDRIAALGASLRADLLARSAGSPPAGPSPGLDIEATLRGVREALLPLRRVLANTSGHLRGDLTLVGLPGVGDWQERIDLTIARGRLDLHRLEDALGHGADLILDFRFADPGLVLEADFSDVAAPIGYVYGGPVGGGLGLAASVRLVEWNLDTGEQELASRTETLDLLTLLEADVAGWLEAQVRSGTAGPSTPGPAPFRLDNIDLALDVRNPAPIPISYPTATGPLAGTGVERADTVIPAGALVGLRATGNIPGPAGNLAVQVERLAFGRTDLRVWAGGGTVEVGAEALTLEGGRADVEFRGGPGGVGGTATAPTGATATVRSLVARGVDVRWIPGSAP